MSKPKQCHGRYVTGTACGRCSRCEDELLELLAAIVDEDPCQYDHHGYCQSHGLFSKPCPHERVNAILKWQESEAGK